MRALIDTAARKPDMIQCCAFDETLMSEKRNPIALLVLLPCFAWGQASTTGSVSEFGCVSEDRLACGCYLRLVGQSCKNQLFPSQPPFFTELEQDAPLWMVLDGEERALKHVEHSGAPIKGDSAGKFSDTYEDAGIRVEIRYAPGANTCQKPESEGCEYTDLRADILVSVRGRSTSHFKAVGSCGC